MYIPWTTLILILLVQSCYGMRFYLKPHAKRCLHQEMYANQLAVGEYDVSILEGTKVDIQITDSKGHIALLRENIEGTGKFAVTSDEADVYNLCFTYTAPPDTHPQLLVPREVYVEFRIGEEAKQYDVDEFDKLSRVENDLNRIEDLTNAIIVDFAHLKKRGQEMRDTNDSTNRRVFYQSVTSVIILFALTSWQILYLRTFFKARKLID